jgi:S-adenosylmethionine/arginine decarboxylase-like enzyme
MAVGKPFGYFVAIDLYGVPDGACDDLALGYRFLEKLVHFLGMTPMAPPYVIHAPSTFDAEGNRSEVYPDKAGISAWQPLIESGIQIHTLEPKHFISIDIFTCGCLDVQKTVEFVQQYYPATKVETYFLERGKEYNV